MKKYFVNCTVCLLMSFSIAFFGLETAKALTVEKLAIVDLAKSADFVFKGTLVGSEVRETAVKKWKYTVYTFQVSRCYRMTTASCPPTAAVVLLDVSGVPNVNQMTSEMIVFLSNGTPTGVGQGIFEIKDGKVFSSLLKDIALDGMNLQTFESELFKALTSTLKGACVSQICGKSLKPSVASSKLLFIEGTGTNNVELAIDLTSLVVGEKFVSCGAWKDGTSPETSVPDVLQFYEINYPINNFTLTCYLKGLADGTGYRFWSGAFLKLPMQGENPIKGGFYDANGDFQPDLVLIQGTNRHFDYRKSPIVLHADTCPPLETLAGLGNNRADFTIHVGNFTDVTVFCGAWAAGADPAISGPESVQVHYVADGALTNAIKCFTDGLVDGMSYQIHAGAYYGSPKCFDKPNFYGVYNPDLSSGQPQVITVKGANQVLDYTQPLIYLEILK